MRAEKGNPAPERIYERRRDGNKIADEEKSEKNSRTRCGKEKCKQPRFNTWVPKEGEEAHLLHLEFTFQNSEHMEGDLLSLI